MKIFIASPLGFADSTRGYIASIVDRLSEMGYQPVDPWSLSSDLEGELETALTIENFKERQDVLHGISMRIAQRNAEHLKTCGGVLAVLDGTDADSGTASEIGYAFGLGGKTIHGLRSDFRQSGEHIGVRVNLQVQYWIEASGGRIVSSIDELPHLKF